MIFKLYDCEFGFKLNGVDYAFDHVNVVTVEDPERNRLTRGANASNKTGITFKEGIREPKRMTLEIMNLSIELKAALDSAFEGQTRVDPYAIAKDGSSKMLKNAILCNKPQQLTLDESPDSMNVSLEFESFDSVENHKS